MRWIARRRRNGRATIPRIDAAGLLDGSLSVILKFYTFTSGSLTPYERLVLNAVVRKVAPETVFEIGTFDGRTTWNLAANAADKATVCTLDLPRQDIDSTHLSIDALDRSYIEKDASGTEYLGTEQGHRIQQLFGDTATFDFSPFEGTIDFVFIDGSHSYEYVKNDSEIGLRLLRSGQGVVVWHDYDRTAEWPGCTRALNELHAGGGAYAGLRHISGTSLVILRR